MKNLIIYMVLMASLTCCSEKRRLANGIYEAFFYETIWTLEISDDEFTYLSSGHLGTEKPVQGNYKISGDTLILLNDKLYPYNKFLIDGDSCLIEVEMQTDYCNKRPNEWGSRWRNINYPQIQIADSTSIRRVHWMLETVLNSKKIQKFFPDPTKNVIIQEYGVLRDSVDMKIKSHGATVTFLSKHEIKKEGIDAYLIINDLRLGMETGHVELQVMPAFETSHNFFVKRNGKWTHLSQ